MEDLKNVVVGCGFAAGVLVLLLLVLNAAETHNISGGTVVWLAFGAAAAIGWAWNIVRAIRSKPSARR